MTEKPKRKPSAKSLANLAPPFQKGQSGNPKGRAKGSRNRLGEDFLRDIYDLWQAKGRDMLERVAEEDPAKVMQVVANLLPKEMKIETRRLEAFTTEELIAMLRESEADEADGEAVGIH